MGRNASVRPDKEESTAFAVLLRGLGEKICKERRVRLIVSEFITAATE